MSKMFKQNKNAIILDLKLINIVLLQRHGVGNFSLKLL